MKLIYDAKTIEKVMNIIGSIPYSGFDNAIKLTQIYELMNEPFKNKEAIIKDENEVDKTIK